jgi:hypothetical protein
MKRAEMALGLEPRLHGGKRELFTSSKGAADERHRKEI